MTLTVWYVQQDREEAAKLKLSVVEIPPGSALDRRDQHGTSPSPAEAEATTRAVFSTRPLIGLSSRLASATLHMKRERARHGDRRARHMPAKNAASESDAISQRMPRPTSSTRFAQRRTSRGPRRAA